MHLIFIVLYFGVAGVSLRNPVPPPLHIMGYACPFVLRSTFLVGERAKRARHYIEIYVYIWYVQDTLVARARWYIMWEELSVSQF